LRVTSVQPAPRAKRSEERDRPAEHCPQHQNDEPHARSPSKRRTPRTRAEVGARCVIADAGCDPEREPSALGAHCQAPILLTPGGDRMCKSRLAFRIPDGIKGLPQEERDREEIAMAK